MLFHGDCCEHFFDVVTEKKSYIRSFDLYEMNEYFEKADQSSRMLGSKNIFDKSKNFEKCMTELFVQISFREHDNSKAIRVEIVT